MTVFKGRTKGLTDAKLSYCPGCLHGVAHRLIGESMEELGIIEKTIGIAPVGCSVFAYNFFACDVIQVPHGRAPAVATGMHRARPDRIVFTYQGDGDLAAIGTAETIHAANRSENITIFFVNNATYGMTGGQMAPTTLPGMKATTAPYGRDVSDTGFPMRLCEILSQLEMPNYIERVSLLSPKEILKAKKAVKKALQYNTDGKGLSFVEMISTCPTNWGMDPLKAREWARENMLPIFPLGVFKDRAAEEAKEKEAE
ncbi:2-oxoglutarate ferredoxin oxidoreductase subunit beta [Desulfatibacillum alkenivorans DSM 16219]|jgi:2-oxoglutarate ferredoxin oxidoreductase subunit beta|uniref:2-oxoglutarate ferredoxin oxidoreductase subunit beta n=1 Tax=Desulfatibacillum alkenivorans DSM 16219 TaxID=1121393 RepID=A0A1M6M743_9BACT|nr:thiamine pyrophosphate-dependent enzyme [Desulfatibacillum alkenivorans]SHJ79264.1 2-oxoglutarate ferredoxin oxidoreductase subunit beta [Desulfatibacillum alkenivorans DSM 16219]